MKPKKHICIDARMMGAQRTRGIGRYLDGVIDELAACSHPQYKFTLLVQSNAHVPARLFSYFEIVEVPAPWYSLKEQLVLPKVLNRIQPDLVHFPHVNVPLGYHGPYMVTVHDLILWDRPTERASKHHPIIFWIKYALFRMTMRLAIERARGVLAVSHYVRHRVYQTFSVPLSRISVVYQNVGLPMMIPPSACGGRRGGGFPYILYVGSLYPHKNMDTLLHAFVLARHIIPELQIKIVGVRDRFCEEYERKVNQLPMEDRNTVLFIDTVDDQTLGTLYQNALCYVQPSLDEGFGLPPKEALLYGTPVIASRAGSLPEILRDRAMFVDPLDVESFAQCIIHLATNTDLCDSRSIENIPREQSSRSILDVYRTTLGID